MFSKILIANRGEIACRIIKTCKEMGIQTVAIYSNVDSDSLHVSLADEAYWVGNANAAESYLNIAAILAIANAHQVDAIHPGYGFLSENFEFARACQQANIIFIGPSIAALKTMGSKQLAKQLLQSTTVPLIPGYHGALQDNDSLRTEILKIGLPVLIKPANGGGGKGMRAVHQQAELITAIEAARREAQASFGDDTLIIEKLLVEPRHIEVQVIADNFGNIVHLFERDCSLQRRHQKIIEEAPAPNLSSELREKITSAACKVAESIEYRNAGTVEFIVIGEAFYFMEMNTRLQVEHPVTEMITNIDLVSWQIQIAANHPLPLTQELIIKNGHAIECRIYAEDPQNNFLPSIGKINFLQEPCGQGIRIDSGVKVGAHISQYYDPMIAKLIAWGQNREQALIRLKQALNTYFIGGVTTNIGFLQAIINNQAFIAADISTHFLSKETILSATPSLELCLLLATSYRYDKLYTAQKDPVLAATFGWQLFAPATWQWQFIQDEKPFTTTITAKGSNELLVTINEQKFVISIIENTAEALSILANRTKLSAKIVENNELLTLFFNAETISLKTYSPTFNQQEEPTNAHLKAPMPSTITAILQKPGAEVKKNEPLLILEAMKMEHTIYAPRDGTIADIFYSVGAQVVEGVELLSLVEIEKV